MPDDDDDDVVGFMDTRGKWEGIPRIEALLQRERLHFVRIYKHIWRARIRAAVLVDITLPIDSKTSIIILDQVVYEGSSAKLEFPRIGIPLPLGKCDVILEYKHTPTEVYCAVQRPSSLSVSSSMIEWGGYDVDMFGKRYHVSNDRQLVETHDKKNSKLRPKRQSVLLTTGRLLKDYFWTFD